MYVLLDSAAEAPARRSGPFNAEGAYPLSVKVVRAWWEDFQDDGSGMGWRLFGERLGLVERLGVLVGVEEGEGEGCVPAVPWRP